jgi:hypothetical protein
MSAYCTESDLYDYGLPRGALVNEGRRADSVDASANSITLNLHGLTTGDAVRFRAAGSGALPTGLVEGTTYYAIRVNETRFQISDTDGGAAIDLTTAGSNLIVIVPLSIDAAIVAASALVEDMVPANALPFAAPYPQIVIQTTAEIAAAKLLIRTGSALPTQMSQLIDFAQKRLERWSSKGVAIRGDVTPEATNLAASSAAASAASDWRRFGGL